jgi:hypothetical protein
VSYPRMVHAQTEAWKSRVTIVGVNLTSKGLLDLRPVFIQMVRKGMIIISCDGYLNKLLRKKSKTIY